MPDLEPQDTSDRLSAYLKEDLIQAFNRLQGPIANQLPEQIQRAKTLIYDQFPAIASLLKTDDRDFAVRMFSSITSPWIKQQHGEFHADMIQAINGHLDDLAGAFFSEEDALIVDRILTEMPENKKAMNILTAFTGSLETRIPGGKTLSITEAGLLLKHGRDEARAELGEVLVHQLESYTDGNCLVTDLAGSNDNEVLERTKNVISSYLVSKGMDGQKFVKIWYDCTTNGEIVANFFDFAEAVKTNIVTINALEKVHAGTAADLNKRFGIINFGRYPENILMEMSEGITKPYILCLFGLSDHNAAFYSNKRLFKNFYDDHDAYQIIFTEAGGCGEVDDRLSDISDTYGQAEFGILGGHGTYDGLELGKEGKYYETHLTRMYFTTSDGEVFKKAFKPDSIVILISCSTAKNHSIADVQVSNLAQVASQKTGLDFIGPDNTTGLKSIELIMDTDRFVQEILTPVYDSANAIRYHKGKKV